jgi:hypothetical protein
MHARRSLRLVACAFSVLTLGACVQGQVAQDYLKGKDAAPVKKAQSAVPAKLAAVEVQPFSAASFKGSPMLLPYVVDTVKPADFKGILEKRLGESGVFDPGAPDALTLTAQLKEWRDKSPSPFPPSIFDVDVAYKLKSASGDVVFDRVVTATGADSTFFGSTRVEIANAKAYLANADALIAALETELGPKLASRARTLAAKAEAEAKLVSQLKPRNDPYVIAADEAPVREFPSTDAPKLGTLKLDTPVTVIGELPDGWMRIAGAAYASAWVYGTALKPVRTTARSSAAAGAASTAASGMAPGFVVDSKTASYVLVAAADAKAAPLPAAAVRRQLARGAKVDAAVRSTNGYILARENGAFVGWISLSNLAPSDAPAEK